MNVIPLPVAPSVEIIEPSWAEYVGPGEPERASELWRLVTTEMRDAGTLSPANGHAIRRLVAAYLAWERAHAEIALHPVLKAKRTGTPAHSAWHTVARDADAAAQQWAGWAYPLTPQMKQLAKKAQ